MKNSNLLFILILSFHSYSFGQSDSTAYTSKDDFSISAFPIVFYLPETKLAFGALGMTVFNIGKTKAWRKSQVQLGLAYTLKKQFLLFIPYELYAKQNWKIAGEIGYYRYFYNYYGLGVNSIKNDLETYNANFPRFISSVLYKVKPNFLAGVQYRFDLFDIPNVGPLLSQNNPDGISGGRVSTIGLALSYDTRDDIFYPRKGTLINFNTEHAGNYTGANFNYSTASLDATLYKTIFENQVLVGNLSLGFSNGGLPYFNYFYLSSGKRGRGFNDRRFIDRNMSLAQLEYRFPIYKRFRGVAFASSGTLAPSVEQLFSSKLKTSYGLGLRFQLSKKQLNHLRLDVAHSAEGFQFYFTIGEAF